MQPDAVIQFFAHYIRDQLGIIYAEHNYFQLQNRLEEISKLLGVSGIQELYQRAQVKVDGAFKQLLLDVATNNETSFFRDPKIFQVIQRHLLDANKATGFKEPLRIWSAASSSGQEALSIAMLIQEWGLQNKVAVPFQITATDISTRILERAKKAEYSQLEIQRGLPAMMIVKYFSKTDRDTWIAKPDLTRHIQYSQLNLKEPYPFKQPFDLVLCRNVLIYQNIEGKKDIIDRITRNLKHGGYLVMGAAEGLLGLSQEFIPHSSDGTVIYQRKPQLQKVA